jgi:hypothetical protein
MPTLTFEAVRQNPWNVITHTLPVPCRPLLLAVAYLAADYCCKSEYLLIDAAADGNYRPPAPPSGTARPCAVEIPSTRIWGAEGKRHEIRAIYEATCGKLTVRPLYTDDSGEFIIRHLCAEDCGEF